MLYHACSVTQTETRITLKKFFNLFKCFLNCSRSTIPRSLSEFPVSKKDLVYLRMSRGYGGAFSKVSQTLRWVTVYGLRFVVYFQYLRLFLNRERHQLTPAAIVVIKLQDTEEEKLLLIPELCNFIYISCKSC